MTTLRPLNTDDVLLCLKVVGASQRTLSLFGDKLIMGACDGDNIVALVILISKVEAKRLGIDLDDPADFIEAHFSLDGRLLLAAGCSAAAARTAGFID